MRYGVAHRCPKALETRVDAVLSAIDVLPLGEPVDRGYGEIRAHLRLSGTPIGPNDLFIAAHAMSEGLTLVTADQDAFRRVEGLALSNWRLSG